MLMGVLKLRHGAGTLALIALSPFLGTQFGHGLPHQVMVGLKCTQDLGTALSCDGAIDAGSESAAHALEHALAAI